MLLEEIDEKPFECLYRELELPGARKVVVVDKVNVANPRRVG